jgi:RyR domain
MDKESNDITAIAKVCHQANKAWCESNGDHSQKDWDEAAEWQRQSAINGVVFAMNNADAEPSAQHDAWMEEKVAEGWTRGDVKDAGKKTHPQLVPYDDLPAEQQKKDKLFRAIVRALW